MLGSAAAPITLVEYGSYGCPYCRTANEEIASVRDRFGERVRYVFRHRPVPGNELARRAAVLVEHARDPADFWNAHHALMTRSHMLLEEDLQTVANDLGLRAQADEANRDLGERAEARVAADVASAAASGVRITPTFFINGRRYDGPWDKSSLSDALLGSLGHRVRIAALDFASWAPSTGILLLLASALSIVLSNLPLGPAFQALWHTELGFSLGKAAFGMSLRHWINDGLLSIFFLVVGLEIKRELSVGRLANRRAAALPIAGALGGMLFPALIYAGIIPAGPLALGWGVPMATDTAFAVALIAMLGSRVPIELRIFLTAAAIVDDMGAITVVALFYTGELRLEALVAAGLVLVLLGLLNRARVYRVTPYLVAGVVLWALVFAGGLHGTLAGVVLALFIPTRPPPNLQALMTQANTIINAEAHHGAEILRHGPSVPALQALDAIHDRLESPADRLLRRLAPGSSYLVLPLFALANAGVALSAEVFDGRGLLALAIFLGLVVGKPLGMFSVCALAVRIRLAAKPAEYSWPQLAGAGALAGIGFTMSLFIAGVAFPDAADFDAAKVAVFAASLASAIIGVLVLWKAAPPDAAS